MTLALLRAAALLIPVAVLIIMALAPALYAARVLS